MSQTETSNAASIGLVLDVNSPDMADPTVVLVRTGNGCWKLPGGMFEPEDSASQDLSHAITTAMRCLMRELREEAGIDLDPELIFFLADEKKIERRGSARHVHTKHFFLALGNFKHLKAEAWDDHEKLSIKTFKLSEVLTMGDFFPPHYEGLKAGFQKFKEIMALPA